MSRALPPVVDQLLTTMKAQRITATALAARAGYDRKVVLDLKTGRHSPRLSTMIDLGAVLGLELVWRPRVPTVDCVDRDGGHKSTNGAD